MKLDVEVLNKAMASSQNNGGVIDPDTANRLWQLLGYIVHHPVMDDLVRSTRSPFDDLALRVLRVVIPKPEQ